MNRLDSTNIDPAQRQRKRLNYSKVMSFRDALLSASSLQELTRLAEQHLKELFNVGRILLAEKIDPEFNGVNQLAETSLKENRIIYIPDTKNTRVIFNGQVPTELDHIFSADLDFFRIDSSGLERLPYGSLVVVPLVSGLDQILPVDQYKRHGIIILYFQKTDMIDPLADMGPLGMYGEFLTAAINSLK